MSGKVDSRTAGEINELLHDAMVIFGRTSGSGMIKVINEYDLTFTQIVVFALLEQGPQTVSSLSRMLKLTPGAVSRLVDRLVRREYVSRREGDEDRRQKTLALTQEGRRIQDRLERARTGSFDAALSELDADLAADLRDVMTRVVAALHALESSVEG
jgi:DNA-binding MarR family transcriptional regulator